LTTFIFDVATSTIQPLLSLSLSYLIPSALTPLPLPYAPYPRRTYALLVSSHLLTGFILSPLDLIRTRLVAQSTLTPHRKYSGPFDALRQILRDEGGWRTIYFHPHLLIPTLLDFTLRPALSIGAPLLIEHTLRLDNVGSPVAYALADFMVSTLALVITLPIETVRRRLQIQPRAPWGAEPPEPVGARPLPQGSVASVGLAAKPFKALRTCVETRPRPYLGVSEAIYRILVEETSFSPVPRQHSREASTDSSSGDVLARSAVLAKHGNSSLGGLRSLYRGFTMGLGANAVVFALTLVSRERNPSSAGWAEI
jgi:fusion and transport protein UGO1